ncbi:phasin family protein [Pseudodonghicola flavimaris]|uniref:Phasin family protein n=1 Tax=Pseudodonghicola flavimaris TaxID=3050036 RepID=A0ABT7F6V2_9RHOB|nr:phasin family protein [Pseudodonghicola flavimaris]MDK3020334.1 phasin family protein [Pseudodonghicola flavimaris]
MTSDKKHEAVMNDAAQAMNDVMSQYQKMGLNALTLMGGDWVEKLSDMGAEMLEFYTQRIKEDVELQHKLLHCRDLSEMQQVQGEFLQRALNRYTEETGKIVEMGTAFWLGGMGAAGKTGK